MLPPPTRRDDVVEVLHGEPVADPYRWLEQADSDEVRAWTEAQNRFTQAYLEGVPARARIRQRLKTLLGIGAIGAPAPAGRRSFYFRRDGEQDQVVLRVRDEASGSDRALVDPNQLNPEGTTALDWFFPNWDGTLVAFGLSENGSEQSVLQVLRVEDGERLTERIPGARAAEVAWLPDGSGFYYTRYPRPGEVPAAEAHYHRAIYFHQLGDDPATDPLIFKPVAKEHWPGVRISPDGRWLTVSVARTFDQIDLLLRDLTAGGGGEFVAVARDLPFSFEAEVVRGRLYLRTNLDAPNYRLFLVDPSGPQRSGWRELVPERSDAVLDGMMVIGDRLALRYLERACSRLYLTDLEGRDCRELPLPTLGSIFGWGGEWNGTELFYGFSSYIVPPSVYRVELPTRGQTLWDRVKADIEPERFELRQETYRSADGTPVTMFLVHRKDLTRDGNRPTYLTGYGGFAIAVTPTFSRSMLLWLEAGGVLAAPNLRGGGEYGEAWHQAGMLATKQHSFDDFIAAAEWLIRERYTRPERLAIAGGSNGGLLMGAVLTQRPELFRAVVIQVPLLDMLRYHRFLVARLWLPEYGDPDDPAQFRWLRAYSPYHHVREGIGYPAVLLSTAESDSRVDPMHARKMAARLQAAAAGGRPVLLRLEPRAGHGAGKPVSKVLEEQVDIWSFVFGELEVE